MEENRLAIACKNHKEAAEQLRSAKTKDEAFKIFQSLIKDYTPEKFESDVKALPQNTELSDEALKGVSGGYRNVSDKEFFGSLFGLLELF